MVLFLAGIGSCSAQVDFPGNPLVGPKKYTKREVGGGAEPGAAVEEPANTGMARYVTHIVLYDLRYWTSVEGKPLAGKLIAFEDMVVTAPKDSPAPAMPEPPKEPTLVKDGKIRLLVNGKPVEVPVERLSLQDREFIDGIQEALDRKAAK